MTSDNGCSAYGERNKIMTEQARDLLDALCHDRLEYHEYSFLRDVLDALENRLDTALNDLRVCGNCFICKKYVMNGGSCRPKRDELNGCSAWLWRGRNETE